MRIIGGYLKGRTLHPKGKITARPTTDFAKEALFNILQNRIDFESTKVLDLFAGTGNITFEFISRGANSVTSIDISPEHLNCIKNFKIELDIENVTIVRADIFKWVKKQAESSFDLIFADPPYADQNVKNLPETIIKSGYLNENGLLIIEHGREIDFESYPFFSFHRKYGNVHFSFFEINKSNG